ncbi:hydrogen peroxide-inducible genes activator [Aeromonas schubertii]|uniref:Hydrogen peroxide-inducible genes activator n=1 Tax=Aeromonas schubertii TaxID=652 RepID=A0A0S2SIP3_9GAMM|nr:hydrogen peroxide-inducible genes activator [Aeromonas schubertii]ALP41560.1 hydrogen peroxide-inducible genes activator [Aeromonas schubertii]
MQRWPSLKQLQYLVALDEQKNFNRAAKACHVSQSTLSTGIQNLEEMMNLQLVERDHKSFIMTPIGSEIVERARRLLSDARDMMELGQHQGGVTQGMIRLGCIPTIAPFLLSRLVKACGQSYPELELLLREDTTANLLKLLEQGELDLLILALPIDVGGFHCKSVGSDPFKMVMRQEMADRLHMPLDYRELPNQSIFLLEREHCLTDHAVSACRLRDKDKINPFAAISLHTLVEMVGAGLGTTFLPQMAIDAGILNNSDLIAIQPPGEQASREIGLVWRPSTTRVQTFYKLAELLKPLVCPTSQEVVPA